jgi:Transglutaminase-like superfamily
MRTVIEAWFYLLYFEFIMSRWKFQRLMEIVRNYAVRASFDACRVPSEELCYAIDLACVFYFKNVKCLQRSAATTLLLRCHGWEAEMVTGAQVLPFRSHAWVEIQGAVANDKPYMRDIYDVLDRC